jgi:hypothetical protein
LKIFLFNIITDLQVLPNLEKALEFFNFDL